MVSVAAGELLWLRRREGRLDRMYRARPHSADCRSRSLDGRLAQPRVDRLAADAGYRARPFATGERHLSARRWRRFQLIYFDRERTRDRTKMPQPGLLRGAGAD